MALSTANAASLYGSLAGVQYATVGSLSASDVTAVEALSTAIDGYDWTNFDAITYTNDIKSHVDVLSGTTWDTFKGSTHGFGSAADVVKNYIDDALVSPDFKT